MELSLESSCEDVSKFFSDKYKITEETRNKLISESISGDVLLDIGKEDLNFLCFPKLTFIKITNYLKQFKDKYKEKIINEELSSISTKENIKTFFEVNLNFKGNLNNIDKNDFLNLDEEKMKILGLNLGQRKRLIRYIKYFNNLKNQKSEEDLVIDITENSEKDEIDLFLSKKLNLSKNLIEYLDGDTLFSLKEDNIDDFVEISEEEKKSLIKFIHKRDEMKKPKITKESKKEDIINFLKDKNYDQNKILEIDLDQIDNISPEEKGILKAFLENEKQINKNNQEKINKFSSTNKINRKFETKEQNLEINSKYNIFFIISFLYEKIDFLSLSIFEKSNHEKIYYHPHFIKYYIFKSNDYYSRQIISFIIQVPSNSSIQNLTISIRDCNRNNKNKSTLHIDKFINYFHLGDIIFDTEPNDFINLSIENIINTFFDLFGKETNSAIVNYQKSLIENINKFFSGPQKNKLLALFVLKYFQFCQKLNIEPNIDKIQLEDLRYQKVNDWKNKLIYLNKEYIEIFNSDKNKCLFSDIITPIYSILDIKYLISLIKSDSKNNLYYISSLFNLLDKNFITRIDFIFDLDKEEIIFIQEKLLIFANNKDKINKIIQLSIGITSCLEFIDSKKEEICQILSSQSSSSIFKKENYGLHYVEPSNKSNEDIIKIYLALLSIIQFTKKNNIVIININNIFQSLVNFYYKGELIEFLNLQIIEQNLNNSKINDISQEKLEDYHKKIHEKGMNLIRDGQMKKKKF